MPVRTIEVELPSGGYGGPSGDMAYEEEVDRTIRAAVPLGCRYVKHETRTIHKILATVTIEDPEEDPKRRRTR